MPSSEPTRAAHAVQNRFAPTLMCFGCGPANAHGLRIESIPDPGEQDRLLCDWTPAPHHQAFPNAMNGGIIGALLDCHSNWTAACHLMRVRNLGHPPVTVTADFHVKLRRPTPMDGPVHLEAWPVESVDDKVVIEATLEAGGKITATCRGTFIAVIEGHPAYHRW